MKLKELSHLKLEKKAARVKMLTGFDCEIGDGCLIIRSNELTPTDLKSLEAFCRRDRLEFELTSSVNFKIY